MRWKLPLSFGLVACWIMIGPAAGMAQETFGPAKFEGLAIGKDTIAELMERLGEPKSVYHDPKSGTTRVVYEDAGSIQGYVEIEGDTRTDVIQFVAVTPNNMSLAEARKLFGPGYEVKRYADDYCLEAGGESPRYESEDGPYEFTVYEKLGIAMSDRIGSLQITFSNTPLGPKESVCANRVFNQEFIDLHTWGELIDQGVAEETRNDFAKAEWLYLAALEKAKEAGPENRQVASTLYRLSALRRQQDRIDEAETLAEQALAIDEKILGPEHESAALTRGLLIGIYRTQGRYAEAEALAERTLEIAEKTWGPTHSRIVGALRRVANLYVDQGKYSEAEPLYRRALTINEKTRSEDGGMAASLEDLAKVYRAQRKYTEAEPLYKRALAIWEQPRYKSGATNMLGVLDGYAALLRETGRAAEAARLEARAAAIREKAGR